MCIRDSVSPIDITTMSGMNTFVQALVSGTPVKVFGVPESNGTLEAYVVLYYTGDAPTN